jgi:hypothetical protein
MNVAQDRFVIEIKMTNHNRWDEASYSALSNCLPGTDPARKGCAC